MRPGNGRDRAHKGKPVPGSCRARSLKTYQRGSKRYQTALRDWERIYRYVMSSRSPTLRWVLLLELRKLKELVLGERHCIGERASRYFYEQLSIFLDAILAGEECAGTDQEDVETSDSGMG